MKRNIWIGVGALAILVHSSCAHAQYAGYTPRQRSVEINLDVLDDLPVDGPNTVPTFKKLTPPPQVPDTPLGVYPEPIVEQKPGPPAPAAKPQLKTAGSRAMSVPPEMPPSDLPTDDHNIPAPRTTPPDLPPGIVAMPAPKADAPVMLPPPEQVMSEPPAQAKDMPAEDMSAPISITPRVLKPSAPEPDEDVSAQMDEKPQPRISKPPAPEPMAEKPAPKKTAVKAAKPAEEEPAPVFEINNDLGNHPPAKPVEKKMAVKPVVKPHVNLSEPPPAAAPKPAPVAAPEPAPATEEDIPPPPEQAAAPPSEPSQPAAEAIPAPAPEPETADAGMPEVPTADQLSLAFAGSSSDLVPESQAKLKNVIKQMKDMEDTRLQVRAYAAGEDGSKSSARRVSLSRALAVRSFLMDNGIKPTRVDVRAMGTETDRSPLDRVDLVFAH